MKMRILLEKQNIYCGGKKRTVPLRTVSLVYNQSPFFSSHLGLTKYCT